VQEQKLEFCGALMAVNSKLRELKGFFIGNFGKALL